ncbi:MAG TPA: zinc-binding dehydrogenase, partial [Microbacteriaceae bacterium]
KLLKPGGIYLTTVPSLPILLQMLWTSKIGKTRAAVAFTGLRKAPAMAQDVAFLGELATAGTYVPVIDKQYTLAQAASAHAHVETGRKRGSVVISLVDAT